MSYVIIRLNSSTRKLTVSFDPALDDTVIDIPKVFLTPDGSKIIESTELTTFINGFAPTEEYIKSYKKQLSIIVNQEFDEGIPLSSIYIPPYLRNNLNFFNYATRLKEKGKFIILDDTEVNQAEYILKYDWINDYTVHQFAQSPDNDNYIYFRNRLAFLRHLKSYVTKIWPALIKSGEIDSTRLYKPSYIPFCVPKSLLELQQFVVSNKKYRMTSSIDKPSFSEYTSSQIINMFDDLLFEQNKNNQNVISLTPSKKVWIVEESFSPTFNIATGYVQRPNMNNSIVRLPKLGVYTTILELDPTSIVTNTLSMFIKHCFYYYATSFEIKYYMLDEHTLVPLQVDVSISLKDPKLDIIYRN